LTPIAECKGISLCVDEAGYLSFTNSPYYAHRHLASVDLYPKRGSGEARSPVEGTVIEARKLKVMDDYFIAIEAGEYEACVKILHAKPIVNVGDHVRPGDLIGHLVWSPFYGFWTDPHMHVEVRPIHDRLRARGGYPLDPTPVMKRIRLEKQTPESLKVEQCSERYILLKPTIHSSSFATGLILSYHGTLLTLEGGLPHYGHGAFWSEFDNLSGPVLKHIKGSFQVDFVRDGYVHFTFPRSATVVRGYEYRGVGLFLDDPHLKLIPKRLGEGNLKVGDEIPLNDVLPFKNVLS